MVPGGGVEPPRGCPRRILSPLRLPVPPSRLIARPLQNGSSNRVSPHTSRIFTTPASRIRPMEWPRRLLVSHSHTDLRKLSVRPIGPQPCRAAHSAGISIHRRHDWCRNLAPKYIASQFLWKHLVEMLHARHTAADHNHVRVKDIDHLRQSTRQTIFKALYSIGRFLVARLEIRANLPRCSRSSP